eukprot:54734-Eustigmatos_ZCMA.PRE.1
MCCGAATTAPCRLCCTWTCPRSSGTRSTAGPSPGAPTGTLRDRCTESWVCSVGATAVTAAAAARSILVYVR